MRGKKHKKLHKIALKTLKIEKKCKKLSNCHNAKNCPENTIFIKIAKKSRPWFSGGTGEYVYKNKKYEYVNISIIQNHTILPVTGLLVTPVLATLSLVVIHSWIVIKHNLLYGTKLFRVRS